VRLTTRDHVTYRQRNIGQKEGDSESYLIDKTYDVIGETSA
jgi:hypothetical protein